MKWSSQHICWQISLRLAHGHSAHSLCVICTQRARPSHDSLLPELEVRHLLWRVGDEHDDVVSDETHEKDDDGDGEQHPVTDGRVEE